MFKRKEFFVGDLVTAPERTHRYEVTKSYEFAIVLDPCYGTPSQLTDPLIYVYLQSTGSYQAFHAEELKLVHREEKLLR